MSVRCSACWRRKSKRECDIKRIGWSVVKGYCRCHCHWNYHVLYFRHFGMILCPFINLIFLGYWFAEHAETLDNHFTTVMMNIMKMVLLTDLHNWFCFFCSTDMSDEGKFGYALNSTNEWEKNWMKKYNWAENAIWMKTERASEKTDSDGISYLLCAGPRHCSIFHVWLPFTIIDTPPNHHTTIHRSTSNSLCFRMLRWNSFKKEICQPIQFNSSVARPLIECVSISTILYCYQWM